MIKNITLFLSVSLLLGVFSATAQASFGIAPGSATVAAENRDGTPNALASSHPYNLRIHFSLNTDEDGYTEGGEMRDVRFTLPSGLFGSPLAVPRCSRQDFEGPLPNCPISSQVGLVHATGNGVGGELYVPLYNLAPQPGVPAEFGFSAAGFFGLPVAELLSPSAGYPVRVSTPNLPLEVSSVTATIWGVPADPHHDPERGPEGGLRSGEPEVPFLTLPASCGAPLKVTVSADSKLDPGNYSSAVAEASYAGQPTPLTGCESVPFSPRVTMRPSSALASSGSGLDFELTLPEEGLAAPGAIAETEPEKMEVALPEGVTANPSLAEGIGVCSEAQFEAEQLGTLPGEGCPSDSKLGSISAISPLVEEPIEGSLYLATPYRNPSHSLIGLYLVARVTERGVLVKQAGKVSPDPATGQLITIFGGLPPLPYTYVKLHFREGARSPLITPPACGTYTTTAKLYPFSHPATPTGAAASFQITGGPGGGACPQGALPFHPGFEAGSTNNQAGAYSPFYMRLTREDGDQDLTKFSAKLPPGVIGRLAGTAQCSDAAMALARSRTGEHGAEEERDNPSCPASSEIGHVVAGAGVGGALVYVPGKLYLAGPLNGAPLSVVAIVPALAGPFDAGTVVVRQALRIDPLTAEVQADGSASDPIPHILKGIPLHVRDIRVYVDKPDFTLNPTSCEPSATLTTIWGGGANVFSSADDAPFALDSRYQAASCASLGFKPFLKLNLRGGIRRGKFPALTGIYDPRQGDANLKRLSLRLPHSAFIEQGHFRTICTRVQFAAAGGNGADCPVAAIYGHARAWTPLLSEPLEGPVYLRSSNHNLPDLVAALHGIVNVEAVARIDSVHGGLRATFPTVPDAPLSRVVVKMQGGRKGLIVNSTALCGAAHRANVTYTAQNGAQVKGRPPMRPVKCGKVKRHRKHAKHHKQGGRR